LKEPPKILGPLLVDTLFASVAGSGSALRAVLSSWGGVMSKHSLVRGAGSVRNRPWLGTAVCGALFLGGLLFPGEVKAQVLYGSLTGTVTDPSGAAVSGAKVQALDVGKGVTQEGTTDGNGIYHLSALLSGVYKVSISAVGFEAQVTPEVRVEAMK
jgi:hypothetical protein